RPTLLLCVDESSQSAQGSGRSIRKLHLYEALAEHREQLRTFGGHAAAAGLTLEAQAIAAFRTAFRSTAARILTPEDLIPVLHVDACVDLPSLSPQFVAELDSFEPCGAGNPRPMLAALGAELSSPPRL